MRILPTVTKEGQPYVDQPIYAKPKDKSALTDAVAEAFGVRDGPRQIQISSERVRLRWMKPGPNGKLVPR